MLLIPNRNQTNAAQPGWLQRVYRFFCHSVMHRQRDRYLAARLAALLGTGGTLILGLLLGITEQERYAYQFNSRVSNLADRLERQFEHYTRLTDVLTIFAETWHANGQTLTPEAFAQLCRPLIARYPDLVSVGWLNLDPSAPISAQSRDLGNPIATVTDLRSHQLTTWQIDRHTQQPLNTQDPPQHIHNIDLQPLAATLLAWQERASHHPHQVLVAYQGLPFERAGEAGFVKTVQSQPEEEVQAIKSTTPKPATPESVKLSAPDVLAPDVLAPDVSQSTLAQGVSAQGVSAETTGMLYLTYNLPNVIQHALRDQFLDTIDLYLVDPNAVAEVQVIWIEGKTRQLHRGRDVTAQLPVNLSQFCPVHLDCVRSLQVGGQAWLLILHPTAPPWQLYNKVAIVLAAGSTVTLLGTSYLWMSRKRTLQLEATSSALAEAEANRQETMRSERLLAELSDQIRESLDLKTTLNTAVQGLQRLLNVDRCNFSWYRIDGNQAYWEVVAESRRPDLSDCSGYAYPTARLNTQLEAVLDGRLLDDQQVAELKHSIAAQFPETVSVAALSVGPIQTQLGHIGLLCCVKHRGKVSPNRKLWDRREHRLVDAVATQLAIALNQAELYEQARNRAEELTQTLKTLQKTQTQLVQTEKMSSLGQLVAGVAHEINNPVNFIYGNTTYIREYCENLLELLGQYESHYPDPPEDLAEFMEEIDLDFLRQDLLKILDSMRFGTERIQEIVASLRTFSRLDEAEMKAVCLEDGIESTLTILNNRLKANSQRSEIKIQRHYQLKNSPIRCYAGPLNQVFMNILSNSIDAIDETIHTQRQQDPTYQPVITITTAIATNNGQNCPSISIGDNGPGIPDQVREHIFDPFFTTKPVGKGTGLGMSISYQIVVERHGGQLICNSTAGQGTEFLILLPADCLT